MELKKCNAEQKQGEISSHKHAEMKCSLDLEKSGLILIENSDPIQITDRTGAIIHTAAQQFQLKGFSIKA